MPRIKSTNGIEPSDDEQEHLFALIHKGTHRARVEATYNGLMVKPSLTHIPRKV